jgi:FdhD protein
LGSVFGDLMTQTHGITLPPVATARISRSTLLTLLDSMRIHDEIHRAAGSVHSCALFQAADVWVSVEDVSRHNAVDTVTGWMALHGVGGGDKILFTTGRLTGEIVMKAAFNGIPIIVSRNGVTAMGYDLAVRLGMTLFGRAANRRYACYAGAHRFDSIS